MSTHQAPGTVAIVAEVAQGTSVRSTSFDRMRDAIAAHPAHKALDVAYGRADDPRRPLGPEVLDNAAGLQLAYAAAGSGNSSRLAEGGFRDAGYIRKQLCGEAPVTLADLCVLHLVTPDRFAGVVDALQRMVDRLERKAGRTFSSAIADVSRRVAELNGCYVEALQDGRISAEEREEILKLGTAVKSLIADIERHCAPTCGRERA